jgi:hypothetical protein
MENQMTLTPAIKGQLTKAINKGNLTYGPNHVFCAVRAVFMRGGMPPQQAKHATRKYLAAHA